MEAVGINTDTWEDLAVDRSQWRSVLQLHAKTGEDNSVEIAKRACRKESIIAVNTHNAFRCDVCSHDCHFKVVLPSYRQSPSACEAILPWSTQTDGGPAILVAASDRSERAATLIVTGFVWPTGRVGLDTTVITMPVP